MVSGKKIVSLRKSMGMSQELLAETSRLSLRTIQRIESGRVIPRPYTIKVIANTLGVPLDRLYSKVEAASEELAILRLINLSSLVVFILPIGNVLLPLLIWRKNRELPLVNETGRKIISFQILWLLGTFLVAVLIHIILHSLTRSVSIGRLPPTIFLIYLVSIVVNFLFIIRAALRLEKGKTEIYSSVPTLF